MKKTIKKIAAVAMAFTLLGTGTAVSKTINPKSSNAIVASAADQWIFIGNATKIDFTCANGNHVVYTGKMQVWWKSTGGAYKISLSGVPVPLYVYNVVSYRITRSY